MRSRWHVTWNQRLNIHNIYPPEETMSSHYALSLTKRFIWERLEDKLEAANSRELHLELYGSFLYETPVISPSIFGHTQAVSGKPSQQVGASIFGATSTVPPARWITVDNTAVPMTMLVSG